MAYREEGTITLKLLVQDLASGKVGTFIGHLDKLAQKGGLVGSIAQGVGQSFGQMLNPVGLVTKGIGTLTDYIGDSVGAASDLQESISKVNVVFGQSADQIQEWSKTSASSVLMSRQAALEAAGTFGNLFDALGLAEQATVDMSKGAVQLAADLASFNNASPEETLLAIRSGLLGEAEPMRKFGSNLSAARVETYALAQGWVKNKAALTESMKVQARYALILEDTKNAQGDVARTSSGLANQQRILDANMANLSATIGQALVGPMAGLTEWLNALVGGPQLGDGPIAQATKEWQALNKTVAETKPPAEGDWLLTGTPFDSALDGLQNLSEGLQEFLRPQMGWITEEMIELGKEAGANETQLYELAKAVAAGGGTFEDFKTIVEEAAFQMTTAAGAWDRSATLIASSTGAAAGLIKRELPTIPTATKKAVAQVEQSMASLVDISRTTLKDTRSEIRDRMRDIKDALEHPFRDQKLEKTYQTAIRDATKKMNKALREGNEEAYAEASEFVREYKAKLRELRMQRFRVRVSMFVDDSGVTGPGATLLGGLAGAAWGSRPARRSGGGPVSANQAYIVGEDRPEVFVPNVGGTIVPSTKGLGGVTFIYAPGYSTASPAEAQRFVSSIGPELDRYLARRL